MDSCVVAVFFDLNFNIFFFYNALWRLPHYQHEDAVRREAIDCATFPPAPGCEGSLWVWHSVTDTGTSTWKDSMFKAAGAEGEICAEQKTPLLCPAVSLPLLLHSLFFLTLFNLSPPLPLLWEHTELPAGAGLCQAQPDWGKRPGRRP